MTTRGALTVCALLASACAPPERNIVQRIDSAERVYAADSAAMVQRERDIAADQGSLDAATRAAAASGAAVPTEGLRPFSAEDSLPTMIEDGAVKSPRLERIGHRSVLHLPSSMMAALRKAAPAFHTFRRADYSETMPDTIYGDPTKEASFAVVGDFDGNGKLDVALYGRDTSAVLLAIVDGTTGIHIFELSRDTGEGGPTIEGYLAYSAPRSLKDDDESVLTIDHDFVTLVHEVSSAIYWYRNGTFESRIYGD